MSAAGPATLSIQEPSAEASGSSPHRLHPTRNSLPRGCADSVRLRITGTARETLTEPERVRPGEESGTAHTHPRLHPASREQTLLRPRGVMSALPSAPPPHIRQQSSSQPTHHATDSQSLLEACCRTPQRGQRYPDVRQPAPQSATHSGWSERGRCALTDASSPLPSSPAGGPHRSSPGLRDSARLRRTQTLRPKRKTAAARSRKSTDFLVNRSRHRSSAPASSLRSLADINHFDSAITIAGIWEDISSMALLSSL